MLRRSHRHLIVGFFSRDHDHDHDDRDHDDPDPDHDHDDRDGFAAQIGRIIIGTSSFLRRPHSCASAH